MDTLVEVGKWILLVLAAGFVGQFGKSLALALLEKRKARKAAGTASKSEPAPEAPSRETDSKAWKKRAKLEKKRLKAEAKRAKKAGLPPGRDVSK